MSYTLEELRETFEQMKQYKVEGVQGVLRIAAEDAVEDRSPVLGITVCTHGDEPCGLAAIRGVLAHLEGEPLRKGTLYLAINNIAAAERYFAANGNEERRKHRLIKVNMNRLPENALARKGKAYELVRLRELQPIFERFEYGLDIHSTSQDMGPMLIGVGKEIPMELTRGFPMERLVSNIDKIQIGKPVCSFFGTPEKPAQVFGIECGQHESSRAFSRAIESAKALLGNLHMSGPVSRKTQEEYEEYWVWGAVMFPNRSYRLNHPLLNFRPIRAGQVIATGDGPDFVMPMEGCGIFAGPNKEPRDITEEVPFLTLPAQSRKVA